MFVSNVCKKMVRILTKPECLWTTIFLSEKGNSERTAINNKTHLRQRYRLTQDAIEVVTVCETNNEKTKIGVHVLVYFFYFIVCACRIMPSPKETMSGRVCEVKAYTSHARINSFEQERFAARNVFHVFFFT